MKRWFLAAAALAVTAAGAAGELRVAGPSTAPRDGLVELEAQGAPEGGAVLWDVFPEGRAKVKEGGNWLVLNGPPGEYSIRAMAIAVKDGKVSITRARHTLRIEGGCPEPKPLPPGPQPQPPPNPLPPVKPPPEDSAPEGAATVQKAIGKIRFGTSGCTATVIHPRRPDGRWDVLTAAHCLPAGAAKGTMTLRDGRSFAVSVASRHVTPDLAWLVAETKDALPSARLAQKDPAPGTKVFHWGFGTDQPGNQEHGTLQQARNGQGQLQFWLSVSPGDSGGSIIDAQTGEVLASVCCTAGLARPAQMWGGSAALAGTLRGQRASDAADAAQPERGGDLVGVLTHPIVSVE